MGWPAKRAEGEELEIENRSDFFFNFFYKGSQINGEAVGRESRIKRRVFFFFSVWEKRGKINVKIVTEGEYMMLILSKCGVLKSSAWVTIRPR